MSGGRSWQLQRPSFDRAQERHDLGQIPAACAWRPTFRAVAAPEGPPFAMEGAQSSWAEGL